MVIRAGSVLYLVHLRRRDVTFRAYPGLHGEFFVSLDLDVEEGCSRDATFRVIGVDGDGPELGDTLRGVVIRGAQDDEGRHQDRAEKDGERDHSLSTINVRR